MLRRITCCSIIGCIHFSSRSFRVLSMVHAKISPMTIQRKNSSYAIFGVDVDISGFWQCKVENFLEPRKSCAKIITIKSWYLNSEKTLLVGISTLRMDFIWSMASNMPQNLQAWYALPFSMTFSWNFHLLLKLHYAYRNRFSFFCTRIQ